MKILGWMLTRMLLIRFIFILLGISIFVHHPRHRHLCQGDIGAARR